MYYPPCNQLYAQLLGHVAALVRSHMNGLKPFERTIEQTTETMLPSPKTITAIHYADKWNFKLMRAARLPQFFSDLINNLGKDEL